jgi:hypothetical protein
MIIPDSNGTSPAMTNIVVTRSLPQNEVRVTNVHCPGR